MQVRQIKQMANPQIETVSSGADKAKLAVAGVLVIAGLSAFYVLGKQELWMRVAALLVLLAAAVVAPRPGRRTVPGR